jgi:hypothetical protein
MPPMPRYHCCSTTAVSRVALNLFVVEQAGVLAADNVPYMLGAAGASFNVKTFRSRNRSIDLLLNAFGRHSESAPRR